MWRLSVLLVGLLEAARCRIFGHEPVSVPALSTRAWCGRCSKKWQS